MAKVLSHLTMVECMLASGRTTKKRAKGLRPGQMATCMAACLSTARKKAKE